MRELQKHSRVPFDIEYLTMNPGYTAENLALIHENAQKLLFSPIQFDSPIFETLKEVKESPCHVCASMRRGYLYKEAQKLGCNKIALGHHKDDAVETILLSMFYGGEYKTMMPKLNSMNYPGMQLIRPLYFVRERDVIAWREQMGIHCLTCACVVTQKEDGGKRKRVKELLAMLEGETPPILDNIFASIEHVNLQTVLGYKFTTKSDIIHVVDEIEKEKVQND